VLLGLVVDGDALQAAVDRPRVHHQWLPDELAFEDGALTPATLKELTDRGHMLRRVQSLGEVHAVRRRADGALEAAADPRGPGSAGVAP
jgi:gamma-glutamyltranspeptidase/glutathione hydrolase